MAKCEYSHGNCNIEDIQGCWLYRQFASEVRRTKTHKESTDHIPDVGERAIELGVKYDCPLLGKMGDTMLETVENLK